MRNIKHRHLAVTEWRMGGLFAIVPRSGSSSCQCHRTTSHQCCCPRGKSLSSRILDDQFSSPRPCPRPWVSSPWQQHWWLCHCLLWKSCVNIRQWPSPLTFDIQTHWLAVLSITIIAKEHAACQVLSKSNYSLCAIALQNCKTVQTEGRPNNTVHHNVRRRRKNSTQTTASPATSYIRTAQQNTNYFSHCNSGLSSSMERSI